MTAVRSTAALRRLLALHEFAEGIAGPRAAQHLLDDLVVAYTLAAAGVGPELLPWIRSAADAIGQALAGPQPMSLDRVMVERIGLLMDGLEQQERMATPAQRLGAMIVLEGRRRGWVAG
jgi:hypothetical protein